MARDGSASPARRRLALAAAGLLLALPQPAVAAGPWSGPIAVDHASAGSGVMNGLACPSSTRCVAVDERGQFIRFDPASPAAAAAITLDPGLLLVAVACPSTHQCTAVAPEDTVTFDPEAPGGATVTHVPDASFHAIACPSVRQCTAVAFGSEMTFDPVAPAGATAVTIDPGVFLAAVACPLSDQCTATGAEGHEVTFNPVAPGSPTAVALDTSGPVGLLACPSARQCTAIDSSPSGHVVTFDPLAPGDPAPGVIDTSNIYAFACPSTHQCIAADVDGRALMFDPAAPGSPTPFVFSDTGFGPTAAACPSSTQCTIVGHGSQAVTFNPSSPGTATPALIDGGAPLMGVACPSTSQCTAVDFDAGHATTFDPISPGTPTPVTVEPDRHLKAVACPSTSQCTAVGEARRGVTFDPRSPATTTLTPVSGRYAWSGVACPSTSLCNAVDYGGTVFTFNPLAGPLADDELDDHAFFDVTCVSAAECVAVDDRGGSFLYALNPVRDLYATAVNNDYLSAVSCPAPRQCTAVGGHGLAVTFDPTELGHAVATTIDAGHTLRDVACPSVTQCTAIDTQRELTFNPRSPGSPAAVPLPGANFLLSIACPSDARCVIVDVVGNGFVALAGGFAPPANAALPTISGSAATGQVLTAVRGAWTAGPASFSHQWQRCEPYPGGPCSAIAGATGETYAVTSADERHTIRLTETAANENGVSGPASSAPTSFIDPPLGVAVQVPRPTSSTVPTAPAGPTAAQLKASLLRSLAPRGKAARIATLLKRGRYSGAFTGLGAGKLAVGWYYRTVTYAIGTATSTGAPTLAITLRLTAAGRRKLRHSKRLTLIGFASFTPTRGKPVSATVRFTLKRRR